MFTERISLAMNQRGQLYKNAPLYQIVAASGNQAALEKFATQMQNVSWAVYRVRRIYKAKALYAGEGKQKQVVGSNPQKKGRADRCVEKLETYPTSDEAISRLRGLAQEQGIEAYQAHGLWYTHLRRCESEYPTSEEFLVAAPASVETKARYGVEHFESKWQNLSGLYCGEQDLPLFASLELNAPE